MTKSAEVVIVGGGIVGSSIAYHLTDQGCSNVLVLERTPPRSISKCRFTRFPSSPGLKN